MAKSEKSVDPLSPFNRFQKLTKALLAVPRREIQDKLDARRKPSKKKKKK
jgi:hypothetical protein